jgi:serine/threonine protein phosphatase PrpC
MLDPNTLSREPPVQDNGLRIVPVAHGLTDVGRHREHNEDHFLVHPPLDLYVVCDGMGGNQAGEVASALATTSLENFFHATKSGGWLGDPPQDPNVAPGAQRLAAGVRKANADVYEISSTRREHKGMGSTLVAVHLDRAAAELHIAHVGDSRCYRVRDGKIAQLTRDHSLIGDALAWNPNLSEVELAKLPKNIISRALGLRRSVEVDVKTERCAPGDIYLLCSDGLCGMIRDAEILEAILLCDDLAIACESLIALANDAGGSDNITAVLLRIDIDSKRRGSAAPRARATSSPSIEILTYMDATVDGSLVAAVPSARCPGCGEEPSVGDLFCGQCGAVIASEEASHAVSH